MYEGSEIMAILLLIAIELYLFYISYSYFSNSTEPFTVDINGELVTETNTLDETIVPTIYNQNNFGEQFYKQYKAGKISYEQYLKDINNLNKKKKDTVKSKHYSSLVKPCLAGCSLDSETAELNYVCENPVVNLPDDHCLYDTDCDGCGIKWPYSVETTMFPLYKFKDPIEVNKSDSFFD